MKLLRFTSEDNNGVFSSTLDQELVIPAKSKIALASCALELQRDKLVIDSSNHEIRFQIVTGAIRSVILEHTDGIGTTPAYYDKTNYQVLFDDVTLKLNNAIGSTLPSGHIQFGAEIGKQAEIKKDRNGKIEIKFNTVDSLPYGSQLDVNTPNKLINGAEIKAVVFTNPKTNATILKANNPNAFGNDVYTCSTFQTHPISRGCGVHRFRWKSLNNQGATATRGGATISFHKVDPSTYIQSRDIALADISFAIKGVASFGGAGGALDGVYHYKLPNTADFVPTAIPISASGNDNTKDVVSLEVVNSRIRGVVYRDNGVGDTIATVLFDTTYDNSRLYASYSLHGAGTVVGTTYGVRIDQIRYTPDPFLAALDPTSDTGLISNVGDDKDLSNSTPTRQSTINTKHDLNFTGDEVSTFFGYQTRRQPATDFTLARKICIFTSQFSFKSAVINDCFMIEMLNLSLDSYDFHSTQRKRKNILAVLPFDEENDKCIFQPNNLAFLDLFNKEEYRTSEIKLRIIRSDYNSVELTGLSTVVLYLD
tara:strand:- start:2398 stop:4008 length:1611 start_codon:yes stop_codon:yes gene_type:complete